MTLIGMHELHWRLPSNLTGQLSVSHTHPVAHNEPLKIWLLGNVQQIHMHSHSVHASSIDKVSKPTILLLYEKIFYFQGAKISCNN